ncbi:glycosyltransferase family 2 protein [Deinococcus yavapaiensis]|uniref:Glycosyltransferase involved in cell wall biosynthesis n=1 Tax=Deinococcus yavapaiensis KR-236 TaxID=694435 RepID=A0A318SH94_9DEIO|nr:glycosyltransferase family 2 protein [Deinococcus yavapaiensis]PYE56495.1 glycosyltransferase involved in cell wall biosynthesis [Deinococcus yavapaiensis KR-236]
MPESPLVSVLMPTFKHATFVRRALESLFAQTFEDWELLLIDDGSPDDTAHVVAPHLADARVRFHRFEHNVGLGAALNFATDLARGRYLAYLPSDDVWYPAHLASLVRVLQERSDVYLAYGGVRFEYRHFAATLRGDDVVGREEEVLDTPLAPKKGETITSGNILALAQVLHRRDPQGDARWTERHEFVSDSLEADFWRGLLKRGARFAYTGKVSCEWVDHPWQRHKVIAHFQGGLSRYRSYYGVGQDVWLDFRPSRGMRVNERERFGRFDEARALPKRGALRVLIVGSLGFNPERVLALEERGHKLYGLWLKNTETWDSAGPYPFGNIETVAHDDRWLDRVKAARPDVIYALLNWQDVRLLRDVQEAVREARLGVPFVFHFKEGPFICLEHGLWPDLVKLVTDSDGRVFISDENRAWFELALNERFDDAATFVLDGDLPKIEWQTNDWAPKLSDLDGEVHTVCAGRPIGIVPWSDIAAARLHVHFYGEHFHAWFPNWTREGLETGFMHLHPTVGPRDWVRELSRYDAAWVQVHDSVNGGDLRRATWDDLNLPARLGTYAAAGLPWILKDNRHSTVAMQSLAARHDFGVFFGTFEDVAVQLRDPERKRELTENARRARHLFAFDTHADDLVTFFRRLIQRREASEDSSTRRA